jgi:Mn-dependent DtxR family transcriptional regulator
MGKGADKKRVADRAQYPGSSKTSAFQMAITRLRKKGLLEVNADGLLVLTDSGADLAGNAGIDDLPATNEEQHERMKESLSPKQKQLFQQLKDGQPHPREGLSSTLGYDSPKKSAFTMLLTRTKKLGYIEYVGNDSVQLTDMAFPLGRP